MIFLQEHTRARTPKVYAAFIDANETRTVFYVVMEFLEGVTLSQNIYKAMDEETQKLICSRLGEQFQLLRSVPAPPEEYFGRVYRQGLNPRLNLLYAQLKEMDGPYDNYDDFISAMYANVELDFTIMTILPEFMSQESEFLSQFKPIFGGTKECKPVLTHMDPKLENIIARPFKGDGGEIKDWEVTLIDWDTLAWFPVSMQCASLDERIWLWDEPLWKKQKIMERVFVQVEDFDFYLNELELLRVGGRTVHFRLL